MKIQCSNCKSNYNIKDEKIPEAGAKIKCPKCQNIIFVIKSEPTHPLLHVSQPTPAQRDIPKNTKPEAIITKKSKARLPKKLIIAFASVVVLVIIWHFSGAPLVGTDAQSRKGETAGQEYTSLHSNTAAHDKFENFVKIVNNIENIKWGSNPENFSNLEMRTVSEKSKQLRISSYYKGESGYYIFFNDKLFIIGEFSYDPEEAEMKLDYLQSKYGEGEKKECKLGKCIVWEFDDIRINFAKKPNDPNTSTVVFIHNKTFTAKEEYRKKIESEHQNPDLMQ